MNKKIILTFVGFFCLGISNYAQTTSKETVANVIGVDVLTCIPTMLHNTAKITMKNVILDQAATAQMGAITSFFVVDGHYIVYSKGDVWIFSSEGACLAQLMENDRIYSEITKIEGCWLEGDELRLYSRNSKKLLSYHLKNASVRIDTLPASLPFNYLTPRIKGGYIGRLTFNGDPNHHRSDLGIFTDSFHGIKEIGPLKLNSGMTIGGVNFALYKDTVLYWRPLENKIYGIDSNDLIQLRYVVDFIGKNIPVTPTMDDYDVLDQLNKSPESYVSLIGNLYESEQMLAFSFFYNRAQYLCFYHKKEKTTDIRKLMCFSEDSQVPAILFTGDKEVSLIEKYEAGMKIYELKFKN